jgi:hypothetical protein
VHDRPVAPRLGDHPRVGRDTLNRVSRGVSRGCPETRTTPPRAGRCAGVTSPRGSQVRTGLGELPRPVRDAGGHTGRTGIYGPIRPGTCGGTPAEAGRNSSASQPKASGRKCSRYKAELARNSARVSAGRWPSTDGTDRLLFRRSSAPGRADMTAQWAPEFRCTSAGVPPPESRAYGAYRPYGGDVYGGRRIASYGLSRDPVELRTDGPNDGGPLGHPTPGADTCAAGGGVGGGPGCSAGPNDTGGRPPPPGPGKG